MTSIFKISPMGEVAVALFLADRAAPGQPLSSGFSLI